MTPIRLSSVAKQLLSADEVAFDGKRVRVRRTSANHLPGVSFEVSGQRYEAIEQNPDKASQWAQLACAGLQVVQFKSSARFVGVTVDGEVTVYSAKRKNAAGKA